MEKTLSLVDTTIGKKALVAVTGFVLFGFVIAHMAGNLQVFLGPEALNSYAAFLKSTGGLLWAARGVLIISVIIHIYMSMSLVQQSSAARAQGYRVQKSHVTTYAANTMKFTGPMLALFIVYHLAHFTVPGVAMTAGYSHSHTDVYSNVVNGFSVPWVALIYIVAQLLLGFHLFHGSWSFMQTLGLSHPRYNELRKKVAQGFAALVVAGNLSMPIAVMAGIIK